MSTRNTGHSKLSGFGNQAMTAPEGTSKPAAAGANESGFAKPGTYAVWLNVHANEVCERVMKVQRTVSEMHPEQLRDANDHLLGAALEAVNIAKFAAREFDTLVRTSRRDALTGTPDRGVMRDRIEQAATLALRRGSRIAVLFIDLDGFKEINDTLGHTAGDEVLALVARRLESVVRDSDTVSRHGGDEFLVLLADIAQPTDAVTVAASALVELAAPAQVGGCAVTLSASLGVAIFPEDGGDADNLVAQADAAMYRAKRAGGGTVRCCTPALAPASVHDNGARKARKSENPLVAERPAAVRELHELVLAHGGTVADTGAGEWSNSTFVVTLPKASDGAT